MKLKKLLIFSFILIMLYLQYGRSPIVNHSIINRHANGYETNLTITVNKLFILNKKQLSKNLIQKVQENDFDNMQFSYDVLGYPNQVTMTVYAHRLSYYLNLPAFTFQFTPKDN